MSQKYCLVAFCTDKSDWISTVIRLATWDRFSHAALVSPDMDRVIEATHGVGVRIVPFSEFMARDGAELRMIPHDSPEKVWGRALSQVGKAYDDSFIYGWVLRNRNWQDPDKWACAEVIGWAGEWFSEELMSSISPRDLHLISKPHRETEKC